MDGLDKREWLLTNGLGGFASGTVCDAHTRTYHGWLIAALDPPGQRTLLLSHLDASLEVRGQVFSLGTHFWLDGAIAPQGYRLLQSFSIDPVPTWVWGDRDWQVMRRLIMPYGLLESETGQIDGGDRDSSNNSLTGASNKFCNRVLIQYRYVGVEPAVLRLRPLVGDRNFHHQQRAEPGFQFSQLVNAQSVLLQAIRSHYKGTPWQLRWTQGEYQPDGLWYWNYYYPEETQRGLADYEDLYSPGYLSVSLQPETSLTLEARVGWPDHVQSPLKTSDFDKAVEAEQQRLAREPAQMSSAPITELWKSAWLQLRRAGDQFITYRASIHGPTVIAGYPWFNDWGRDTLIALPGLALTTRRFELAKGLLQTFGRYCDQGLIPNTFPDVGEQPAYNSIDAALWWIEILGLYLESTQDWDFLAQQYPVVQKIYKAFTAGTIYNIRVDAADGLVTWDAPGVALTWMDALVDGQPITPRRGKPVEINALWYSVLCWLGGWAEQLEKMERAKGGNPITLQNQARRYVQHAQQVENALQKFWWPAQGYLYDAIAPNDSPDPTIRPNAVLALSLHHCAFTADQGRQILEVARQRLLTPYGLRSLDPSHPAYIGSYAGNSHHRDRAYHQGTVWSWLLGPFIRAWQRFYPVETPLPFDGQPILEHLQQQACLGSISEIFDGDPPHAPQGAIAQAWSVAELIRHWTDIIPKC